MSDRLQVAIPLFDQCTALDAIGPYEVLQRIPTIDITFIGHARGEVRTENRMLGLTVDGTFEDLPEPDVIVFPAASGHVPSKPTIASSSGCAARMSPPASRPRSAPVRSCSRRRGYCKDSRATTHWGCYDELAGHGAQPTPQRVVELLDHRIITSAGVSSGIDMALRLTELLFDRTAAEAAQLMIEYDPQPPFDAGSVAKAPEEAFKRVVQYAQLRG